MIREKLSARRPTISPRIKILTNAYFQIGNKLTNGHESEKPDLPSDHHSNPQPDLLLVQIKPLFSTVMQIFLKNLKMHRTFPLVLTRIKSQEFK